MERRAAPKRAYRLRKRADEMAETRRRIAEAAVHLHGTIGPARTTLSAIAEAAGVQRHTVYRHFPSDADLFGACSAHFFALNPWPDLAPWRTIADPRQRLRRALGELYSYYARTAPMFANVLRDIAVVRALGPTLAPMQAFLADAVATLVVGWPCRGRRRRVVAAAVRHAIDFQTWRSLVADNGLDGSEAVDLMTALVDNAGREPIRPRRR